MKKLYFDSSYLFRIYSTEAGHEKVKALLSQSGSIASAQHARAEFATIILRQRREQRIAERYLIDLHEQFLDECRDGHIELLPFSSNLFVTIERVLRASAASTFLRAADALHLACAAENGFQEVYSNDKHFLAAAPLFGLRGLNIISTL